MDTKNKSNKLPWQITVAACTFIIAYIVSLVVAIFVFGIEVAAVYLSISLVLFILGVLLFIGLCYFLRIVAYVIEKDPPSWVQNITDFLNNQ